MRAARRKGWGRLPDAQVFAAVLLRKGSLLAGAMATAGTGLASLQFFCALEERSAYSPLKRCG